MAQAPKRKPTSVSRPIKLGDKTYTLLFNFSALSVLEDLYDAPIKTLGERFSDASNMRIRDLQRIVYAGLRAHHPEVSEDDVITLLDDALASGGKMEDVLTDTFAAFNAAGEDETEGGDKADPRTAAAEDAT